MGGGEVPLVARCPCAVMGRGTHHPVCPLWRSPVVAPEEQGPSEPLPSTITEEQDDIESPPSPNDSEEEPTMARRKSAVTVNVEPATAREAREYLLDNQDGLPEGVTVGTRGRLSAAAKEHFTKVTGRPISE